MAKGLCPSCAMSIWCPTWAEWRCKAKERRIYEIPVKCEDYKKREKDFKEPRCQCQSCLENEKLYEDEEE